MRVKSAKRKKWIGTILGIFEWRCVYCPERLDCSSATIDHVVPVSSENPTNRLENWVPACKRCNGTKGAMSALEWIKKRGADLDRFHRLREVWCTHLFHAEPYQDARKGGLDAQLFEGAGRRARARQRRLRLELLPDWGSLEPGRVRGVSPPRSQGHGPSRRPSDPPMQVKSLAVQLAKWAESVGARR